MISFSEFKKKQDEVDKYKNSILKLIDEFILLHKDEFIELSKSMISYEKAYDFYNDNRRDNDFTINYYYGGYRTNDIILSHKLYKELQNYMKDPDLYRNTKKYNL